MDANLTQALQKQLDRWQLFAPCLGANVTIEDSVHGAWNAASGYADPDAKTPLLAGGRFYIYSITKTFTAVRVLQLAERGLLALDAPVTSYLPELPFPTGVTLRRLLNHTGGVPDYTGLPEYDPAVKENPSNPWSYEHTMALTCDGRLDFAPGESWRYSNTGYMLLVRLIETLTQTSFAANIEAGILRPLGLKSTYLAEEVNRGALVPGFSRYLNEDGVMQNITPRYHPWWCKTGLIASTTEETVQFYSALFSGSLLNRESFSKMRSWVPAGEDGGPFFKKPAYGLGLMIDPDWGFGGLYGHGGEGPGYNTWAMVLPDFYGRRIVLAVFTNTSMGGQLFYLVKDLLRVLKAA